MYIFATELLLQAILYQPMDSMQNKLCREDGNPTELTKTI